MTQVVTRWRGGSAAPKHPYFGVWPDRQHRPVSEEPWLTGNRVVESLPEGLFDDVRAAGELLTDGEGNLVSTSATEATVASRSSARPPPRPRHLARPPSLGRLRAVRRLSTGEGDPAAITTAPFESSRGVPGFRPRRRAGGPASHEQEEPERTGPAATRLTTGMHRTAKARPFTPAKGSNRM